MKKIITILALAFTLASCSMGKHISVDACPKWTNNIHNPENEEFVEEVAFNLHKSADKVTQVEFNQRYGL
jgi:PBP1b-binding outer membrane lipoprotein LpoB